MKERLDVLLVKRNPGRLQRKGKGSDHVRVSFYVNGQKEDKAGTTLMKQHLLR